MNIDVEDREFDELTDNQFFVAHELQEKNPGFDYILGGILNKLDYGQRMFITGTILDNYKTEQDGEVVFQA